MHSSIFSSKDEGVIPLDKHSAEVQVPPISYTFPHSSQEDKPTIDTSPNKTRRKTSFGHTLRKGATLLDASHLNIKFKETIGYRIRKVIYKIEGVLGPIVTKFIPNFIAAHYFYILSWIIIGSIVIYPCKNISYIDALFFASGSATQAGLNTVDLNLLKLYQQIVIYVICMFTTPIFIHSSLTFLRLYWYEKTFDGIQKRSIEQFKLRRSATLAQLRSETMNPTRANTFINRSSDGFGTHNASEGLNSRMKRFQEHQNGDYFRQNLNASDKNFKSNTSNNNNYELHDLNLNKDNEEHSGLDSVAHLSEPSDTERESNTERESEEDNNDGHKNDHENINGQQVSFSVNNNNGTNNNEFSSESESEPESESRFHSQSHSKSADEVSHQNIKFADLPKPSKKRRGREINPRDLYMSISMLQQNEHPTNKDFESGPALRIKGPRELEREENNELRENDHRLPGHHHKRRRRHKEKKLQEIRNHDIKQVQQENHMFNQEIKENRLFNQEIKEIKKIGEQAEAKYNSHPSIHFDIGLKPRKKHLRSLSVPAIDVQSTSSTPSSEIFEEGKKGSDSSDSTNINIGFKTEENVDNTKSLNQKDKNSKKINKRAHTIDDVNPSRREFDISPTMEAIVKSGKKLPHFFSKTFTGGSRMTRAYSDPSELSDDELVSMYSDQLPNHGQYLSWNPTVGRNSTFVALSDAQKYELGGVEYRAMKLLATILVVYYVGFHVTCLVFFLPFITTKDYYKSVVRSYGITPAWWGFFTAQSVFNDLGYTLTPNSMYSFAQNAYILIIASFFIVIGNTGFPILLRFIIYVMKKLSTPLTIMHESLSFLLEHPRRCFTLLFPAGPTWWLFVVLVILNAIDWFLFLILDFHSAAVKNIPKGYRVLDGLFQAFSTRTAGFGIVDLSILNPAIQVSYMVMMYISVLPLAISIRRTNVYEEQSLGVYRREEDYDDSDNKRISFIATHLRKQLSFDLWFLFLAIFIICICESGRIRENNVSFGIFQIMFEVTSAYGTVGLSMGFPNTNTSFCGQFNTLSKLVMIATMIRGRHRGLPNSIDRAIMLSQDKLNLRDDLEAYHNMKKTNTGGSTDLHSLFPHISQAATHASTMRSGTIHRQPTISQDIRKGKIPLSNILKESARFAVNLGKNIFTMSSSNKENYPREFTRYNTQETGYTDGTNQGWDNSESGNSHSHYVPGPSVYNVREYDDEDSKLHGDFVNTQHDRASSQHSNDYQNQPDSYNGLGSNHSNYPIEGSSSGINEDIDFHSGGYHSDDSEQRDLKRNQRDFEGSDDYSTELSKYKSL